MNKVTKEQNIISKFICKAQGSPAKMIALSFLTVIFIGTLLLLLPIATVSGKSAGLLTALFTATSATCVTGLVIVDTATYWSLFGQIVILFLIQIGGLGLVTLTTFFFTLLKRKMGLKTIALAQECTASFSFYEVRTLVRKIILLTLSFESIGAIVFIIRFVPKMGIRQGILRGVFHSVSSFCNAGFDLMGTYSGPFSSITSFENDPTVVLMTSALVISGGLGFIVWSDILNINNEKGTNFHTKIVLKLTFALLVIGTIVFFASEYNNLSNESMGNLSFFRKIQSAFFQSVTARTAGFNTISQGNLTESSKILTSILMFIGASSGSTGGGIKITTFSVIFFFVYSEIKGNPDFLMLKRRIPKDVISRSVIISFLAVLIIITTSVLLTIFEAEGLKQGTLNSLDLFFESISAFGTVGLSAVGTPDLQDKSHALLILTMFIGRIGPASFAIALAGRSIYSKDKIYPEGKILVG